MSKKIVIGVVIALILLIVVASWGKISGAVVGVSGEHDVFAQCLTDSGAVFYGSYQCPHCATQKKLFGNSIKHVNYIECGPLGGPVAQECLQAGIRAYPTWIINGVPYTGTQSLEQLSQLTGCPL